MTKINYNWGPVEQYLDVVLKNGSANREKKYITLRKFRDLIQSGVSLNGIAKTGTSKHVTQFFSNFCQGKIILSKEDFIKEYEKGRGLDDIAKQYNISRGDITFLRQLYNIKRKGATFQHRKATEVPLTQRQREIIYGSMMGDAKKFAPASVGFGHGPKQKSYLEWKYEELKSLATKLWIKEYISYDKRSGNMSFSYRFYTYSNTELEEINKLFYSGEEKEISTEILSNLTPLSIAVWFMDDGKTDWSYSTVERTGWNITPTHGFCTDSFSLESCENIKKWFPESYNIKCRIKSHGLREDGITMKYRILIEHESNDDFIELIKPHMLPLFNYKIDYQEYSKWRKS